MPSTAEITDYHMTSKLLAHGRPGVQVDATGNTGSKAAALVNTNATLASESGKMLGWWLFIAAILAGLAYASPLLGLLVATFGIPFWFIGLVIIGFWSACQVTYRLATPMGDAWRHFNPSMGNPIGRTLLGLITLPLILLMLLMYWSNKAFHVLEVKRGRKSDDPAIRRANEYYELGRRDYWFRAYREAKRRELNKEDFDWFLVGSTLGVLVPAKQFEEVWGEEAHRLPKEECARIVDDLTAIYGLPKK